MMPFWALEIPSAEGIHAKDTQGLWATAVLPFVASSAEGSLQLPVQLLGFPLRWILPLHSSMASGYILHWCQRKLPALVGQGHQSTQSWRVGCLFPPLSWGQNPSSPGHRTHCSLLINMNWRSQQEDQSNISPSILFENLPT